MNNSIPLYWHVCDNFGDALAPWLVEKISGRRAQYVEPGEGLPTPYLVTGSILGSDLTRGTVWGAGSAFRKDLLNLAPPSEHFKIIATRGPLSCLLATSSGHKPTVFGDPGLLLPRLLQASADRIGDCGVFCSWINEHEVPSGVPVHSSLTASIEQYVTLLHSYDVVLAGCLHALIAAIAYGRKVAWVRFSTPLLGDGFKFEDFFASMGLANVEPIFVKDPEDIRRAVAAAQVYDPPDSDPLWDCCPFR